MPLAELRGCLVGPADAWEAQEARVRRGVGGNQVIIIVGRVRSLQELGEVVRPACVDRVYVGGEVHALDGVERALECLVPGGQLVVHPEQGVDVEALRTTLVLAGFVDVAPFGKIREVCAKKPVYNTDAVKLKQESNGSSKNATWKIVAHDNDPSLGLNGSSGMADEELADDDDLLEDDEDLGTIKVKPATCGPDGGAKKRACKNCSCGLKELEEAAMAEGREVVAKPNASSCGNCSKGDAFRCATCPYLGTPAFEPGQKPPIKVQPDGTKILLDFPSDL